MPSNRRKPKTSQPPAGARPKTESESVEPAGKTHIVPLSADRELESMQKRRKPARGKGAPKRTRARGTGRRARKRMNEEYYRVKVEQAPVTITKADGSTEVLEDLPPVTYGATKSAPRLRKRPRTIHANAKENSGKGEPNPKQ